MKKMAVPLHKLIVILPLLFLAAHAKTSHKKKEKHKDTDHDETNTIKLIPKNPFISLAQPKDDLDPIKDSNIPTIGDPIIQDVVPNVNDVAAAAGDDVVAAVQPNVPNPIPNVVNQAPLVGDLLPLPDFETPSIGKWEFVNPNAGVSAMHIQLLPNNKIYLYDATIFHISRINFPPGVPCLPFVDKDRRPLQDCFAHAVEYDVETNQVVRTLRVVADPWCSSGGVAPDGTLVGTGGFLEGTRAIRFLGDCPDCQFREQQDVFKDDRWYATQAKLPNGEFIVMGGRRAFSWEFVPKEGQKNDALHFFPFLYETADLDENNLYPFVHLSVDGNLFVFSNNRSILFDAMKNKILRTYPVLAGGSRNYPASGMSALLPIYLNAAGVADTAEVIVCGGNTPDAFHIAETVKQFLPALQDCNRMVITDKHARWQTELMPSRRTMGDLLNLPNGQLLFINGAQAGTSAWYDGENPNFTPVLYSPHNRPGQRFKVLAATLIPRMYHSSSAVLSNGKIWVSGSNPNEGYRDVGVKYITDTRVENFSPPYLDPALDVFRPVILDATSAKVLKYNAQFQTSFTINDYKEPLTQNNIKVTLYAPPFTTHGYSMNQRQLVLMPTTLVRDPTGVYSVAMMAPASGMMAPPGYYLLYVVHRGVPSRGMWVQIGE